MKGITEDEVLAAIGLAVVEALEGMGHSGEMVIIYEVGRGNGHLSTISTGSREDAREMARAVIDLEPENRAEITSSLEEILERMSDNG